MRLHLLEHESWDYARTNITRWVARKGYRLESTDVFRGAALPRLVDFDWLMVMGGVQHAWEEDIHPWLPPEKELMAAAVAAGKPVVGVCLGAQLLAEVLGGRVFTNDQPEIGWYEVGLTSAGRRSFLFDGIPDRFASFHWHHDHFSLPPGCTCLAGSPPTANQAFIKQDAAAVGIQFHPEYTRRMVLKFAEQFGHQWVPGPYVSGQEAVITATEQVPDTYWLMHRLMENIDKNFNS